MLGGALLAGCSQWLGIAVSPLHDALEDAAVHISSVSPGPEAAPLPAASEIGRAHALTGAGVAAKQQERCVCFDSCILDGGGSMSHNLSHPLLSRAC